MTTKAEGLDRLVMFWSKVRKSAGCWEWTAATNTAGYGIFGIGEGGKTEGAHRQSRRFSHGKIPDGMCVLHRCDNPLCVKPQHLFLGTHADNQWDKIAKGRHPGKEKTHCKNGHAFTPENTYRWRGNGKRACRRCRRERSRRHYWRQRAISGVAQ